MINIKDSLYSTDNVTVSIALAITRSIEVICLAQFFALIPRQLYRDRELSIIYELNMAALPG